MDIHQIRMANYRSLLRDFANSPDELGRQDYGRMARFSAKAGVNPRYLSHVNNGRKNLGEDLCRDIERGLGLAFGWMDQSAHDDKGDSIAENPAELEFVKLALELYRRSPLQIQQALLRAAISGDKVLPADNSGKP